MVWFLIILAIIGLIVNYKVFVSLSYQTRYNSILGTLHVISYMTILGIMFLLYIMIQKDKVLIDKLQEDKPQYELIQEPLYKLKKE